MKKNIALMALTGILTLSACTTKDVVDNTKPVVTLKADPISLPAAGGKVVLSGTATDAGSGIASVKVTGSDGTTVCTPTPATDGTFSCTTTIPANTAASAVTYTYTATATDKATASNSESAIAKVTVAGAVVTQTGSLSLTKPDTVTATVKDANGTVIPSTQYSAMAPGNYRITWTRNGYVSQYTDFTITANQNTVLTAPVLVVDTTSQYYYTDSKGNLVQIPAADLRNPDKFTFDAWLENLYLDSTGNWTLRGGTETGIIPTPNTVSGTAIRPEQTEVAPSRTQNLAVAYVGYKAADGKTYPVSGAKVRWNIVGAGSMPAEDNTPVGEWSGEYDYSSSWKNDVIFGAADGGASDTNFGGVTEGSISAAGKQADTITNRQGVDNSPFPSQNASYPLYNSTGIGSPDINGVTWVTLFSPSSYASAKVVAVASINGMEIDKQIVDKFFAAKPSLKISKTFIDDSDSADVKNVPSRQVDGTVPVDANNDGVADGWVTMRIRVTNDAESSPVRLSLRDILDYGNSDSYKLVDVDRSYAGPTARQIINGGTPPTNVTVNVYRADGTGPIRSVTLPVTPDYDGFTSATRNIDLQPGEYADAVFNVTSGVDGLFCDKGIVTSYYSPFYGVTNNPDLTARACAIFTAPRFTIDKSFADGSTEKTVSVNEKAAIKITVTNNGNQTGSFNNVIEELVRVNGTLTSVSAAYSVSDGSAGAVANAANDGYNWNTTTPYTLKPGESKTFTFNAQASEDGRYCDIARFTTASFGKRIDEVNYGKTGEVCLNVVTLDLTKTNSTNDLRPGENYVSTITLSNPSPWADVKVNLWDVLGYNKINGQYVEFGSATYQINNGAIQTISSAASNKVSVSSITIPRAQDDISGKVVLKVTSRVPNNAAGVYCDYAHYTIIGNTTDHFKEACVYVTTSVSLQTQITDVVDPIVRNNGATIDGRTGYTTILSNEATSNEPINKHVVSFAFGTNSPAFSLNGNFNNPTSTKVYYDPTPQRDTKTGAVISGIDNVSAAQLTEGTQFTITYNEGGEQVMNINQQLVPKGAFFIVHDGITASPTVPAINPFTNNQIYYTDFLWQNKGVNSGIDYIATGNEPTSVK